MVYGKEPSGFLLLWSEEESGKFEVLLRNRDAVNEWML